MQHNIIKSLSLNQLIISNFSPNLTKNNRIYFQYDNVYHDIWTVSIVTDDDAIKELIITSDNGINVQTKLHSRYSLLRVKHKIVIASNLTDFLNNSTNNVFLIIPHKSYAIHEFYNEKDLLVGIKIYIDEPIDSYNFNDDHFIKYHNQWSPFSSNG